jgi:hypothetical protein
VRVIMRHCQLLGTTLQNGWHTAWHAGLLNHGCYTIEVAQ